MRLSKVAILGRPNVGKSTLFNQLTGTRRAVVKDEPGTTRDVQVGTVEWRARRFEIFDTAGVTEGGRQAWSEAIRRQALAAAEKADKVIFVLDGKFGLNPEDKELTRFVRKIKKPVIAVVNKLDSIETQDESLSEFYSLGFENLVPTSFEHKLGLDILLDWIVKDIPQFSEDDQESRVKLAVVGKPNAGKSTLVNAILGEERVVVSPVAGTTVDSVEIPFERGGQEFALIDTAGLRRHAKRTTGVEYVSAAKTEDAIERSHILLLVIDSVVGPSQQDARIVELAVKHHRAVVLVLNKIDLAEKKIPRFRQESRAKIENQFHFYQDIPVAFVSAQTGRGIDQLFELTTKVWERLNFRISTREINEFFFNVIRQAPSPSFKGKDIKFHYITQTKQRPPSFMAFVNEPRGVTNSYKRFISAKIKAQYDLSGIPIRIYPKKSRRGDVEARHVSYGHPEDY